MKHYSFLVFFLLSVLTSACVSTDQLNDLALNSELSNSNSELTTLFLPPYLPEGMRTSIRLPEKVFLTDEVGEADVRMDVSGDSPVSRWTYVLVGPFDTLEDDVTLLDLQKFWLGDSQVAFPAQRLIMDGSTQALFTKLWGRPSSANIASVSANLLLVTAWKEKTTWALIPFEDLNPQWKVISVDGVSPIDKVFDPTFYGLNVTFSLIGKKDLLTRLIREFNLDSNDALLPASNRDADKLTIVAMTGATSLARGTAYLMENFGMTYLSLDIGEVLRNADITHICNENAFSPTCPRPLSDANNNQNLIFCSRPEYIQLLEAVGADVIEMTGDHLNDWGEFSLNSTLDMYVERGWQYYGGGRNLGDGLQPALFVHNGNRIAFLGCNAKPVVNSIASEVSPGAVSCDLDVMDAKIKEVIAQGYLPIFSFQHIEYYRYTADPHLVEDFHRMAQAGAVIVSGSQANQPHAIEFFRGAFLHYGLGKLFFDPFIQGYSKPQAFIDLHVFYKGKHISTKLVTIIFADPSRPRLMTLKERQKFLEDIFLASNWF